MQVSTGAQALLPDNTAVGISAQDRVTPSGKAKVSNVVKGGRLTRRNAKGAATLRRLADKRGWTASTLQRQTRATEETVNKWLAGTARPRRHELITMAYAFGEQDWDELLDGYGARRLISAIQGSPRAQAQTGPYSPPAGPPGGGAGGVG